MLELSAPGLVAGVAQPSVARVSQSSYILVSRPFPPRARNGQIKPDFDEKSPDESRYGVTNHFRSHSRWRARTVKEKNNKKSQDRINNSFGGQKA